MPTYVCLANWTQQGVSNIKDSAKRLKAARKAMGARGMKIKDFYMTIGRYDMVFIVEAENDVDAAKSLLETAAAGNVRTLTMRAFTEAEYKSITEAL